MRTCQGERGECSNGRTCRSRALQLSAERGNLPAPCGIRGTACPCRRVVTEPGTNRTCALQRAFYGVRSNRRYAGRRMDGTSVSSTRPAEASRSQYIDAHPVFAGKDTYYPLVRTLALFMAGNIIAQCFDNLTIK